MKDSIQIIYVDKAETHKIKIAFSDLKDYIEFADKILACNEHVAQISFMFAESVYRIDQKTKNN